MSDETLFRIPGPAQARLIPLDIREQTGPSLDVIKSIHRGSDGYVALSSKQGGDWQEIGAFPLNREQLVIPSLLDHLAVDGYFGLNSSFGTSRRKVGTRSVWKPIPDDHPEFGNVTADWPRAEILTEAPVYSEINKQTGLPWPNHRSETLRWLNVCHVDLDCYKVGLSVGDTLGAIINMQDAGQLPPATLFARSGRGVWAFWYLLDPGNPPEGTVRIHNADHDQFTPQRASKRAVAFYAKIQRALADRLGHLGADLGALDGVRFAPVPGTVESTTGTRVEYWLQGAHGHGFAYTLIDLAAALGVEMQATAHPIIEAALSTPATNAALAAAGRKGWEALNGYLLADFRTLINLRGGGFAAGIRHRALFLYAVVLKRNKMNRDEVYQETLKVASRCQKDREGHGIHHREVSEIVRQAFRSRTRGLRNAHLFADLQVTPTEATYLSHIRPDQRKAPPVPAADVVASRRAIILDTVKRLGRVPSTREMAAITSDRGAPGNFTTIARDYQALGLKAVKGAGRPKKATLF